MNPVFVWLSEQWELIGKYFGLKSTRPPLLLCLLMLATCTGIFFLNQPWPGIILFAWLLMLVLALITSRSQGPQQPTEDE